MEMQPSCVQPPVSRSGRLHSSASLDTHQHIHRRSFPLSPRISHHYSAANLVANEILSNFLLLFLGHVFLGYDSHPSSGSPFLYTSVDDCSTLRIAGFRPKFAMPTTPRPEGPQNPEPKPEVMAAD